MKKSTRKKALWTLCFPSNKPEPVKRSTLENRYNRVVKRWKSGKRCCRCSGFQDMTCHHWKGRVGALLLDERFWLPVCAGCHKWIDDNRAAARKLNLLCEFGRYNCEVDGGIIGLAVSPAGVALIKA